jgi:hypothetical protein
VNLPFSLALIKTPPENGLTMVCGRYNYSYIMVYKPTNITGGAPSCTRTTMFSTGKMDVNPPVSIEIIRSNPSSNDIRVETMG